MRLTGAQGVVARRPGNCFPHDLRFDALLGRFVAARRAEGELAVDREEQLIQVCAPTTYFVFYRAMRKLRISSAAGGALKWASGLGIGVVLAADGFIRTTCLRA